MSIRLFLAVPVLCLACGDSGDGAGGAGGLASTTSSSTASTSTTATTSSSSSSSSSSATSSSTGGAGGAVSSCAAISSTDCFSNYDCTDQATRCQNVGSEDAPLACCVTGARGTGALGDPCTGESDCASSLCIETDISKLCSDKCKDGTACIASLPTCESIAFSGSSDKFCTP